ncbi:MAG TPA: type VI secretion system baseplate subunit TssF, partial [Planctomycetota bacterium]|nr:type VI secretion system baseplate subunit TssF [Planctomycetota bacterium]
MFNKYYQDELSFLREMGAEFSKLHDKAAPFLGREGTDPDVERLLEGFAFLTGRIRQKLEDELPEVTHALMDLLWPHYLRPIPSMAILQFEALPQAAKEAHRVPRGPEVDSIPVDGTSCRFQTVYEVSMEPLFLERIEMKVSKPPLLRLNFRVPDGVSLQKVQIPSLRFHLQGEPAVTTALYLCLTRNVERVVLRAEGGGDKSVTLGPEAVRPAGFHPQQALLPAPPISFEGFRLFQEYFAFVTKFLFVDLTGLERLK